MKKFKLNANSKQLIPLPNGQVVEVFQIEATCNFTDVHGNEIKKGTVGGYVQSITNLSQEGACWVGLGSVVARGGIVKDNALVTETQVFGTEVAGDAVCVSSRLVGGKVEGEVINSTILYSKVRTNACVINSTLDDGAKIGKKDMTKYDYPVTISNSNISGTYVACDSVISNSTLKTPRTYKLVSSNIINSTHIDPCATAESKLNITNIQHIISYENGDA